MAYSNKFVKGAIGFTGSWPVIVIERARSDAPLTPALCEVFGFAHESGSVYLKDITLTVNLAAWREAVRVQGHDPDGRYFKGALVTVGTSSDFARSLGIEVWSSN